MLDVAKAVLVVIDVQGKLAQLMADKETMFRNLQRMILGARALSVPILLVEQNARIALKHSNRAYVIESGEISTEGNSADLLTDPRVKAAYLGEG